MRCPVCGEPNRYEANYCDICGAALSDEAPERTTTANPWLYSYMKFSWFTRSLILAVLATAGTVVSFSWKEYEAALCFLLVSVVSWAFVYYIDKHG